MISRQELICILKKAVQAPSGANLQPWKFKLYKDRIEIINDNNVDKSVYSFNRYSLLISHGALIENITISAAYSGYDVHVEYGTPNSERIAIIFFTRNKCSQIDISLYPFIDTRVSNRKPYKLRHLNRDEMKSLDNLDSYINGLRLVFISEDKDRRALSKIISLSLRLELENKSLHDFLFQNIIWTTKREKKNGRGIYVRTLEFNRFQIAIFWVLNYWYILKFLNKFGISKIISRKLEDTFFFSSSIGGVIFEDQSNTDYIGVGRLMQRLWLVSTKLGLSLQLSTSIPLLARWLEEDKADLFTPNQKLTINKAYDEAKKVMKLSATSRIAIFFRIGESQSPRSRSKRLSLDKFIIQH